MWKTACLLAFLFSFESYANTCGIVNAEGLIATLKESLEEKEYKQRSSLYVSDWKERSLYSPRPEIGLSFEGNKDDMGKNEVSADILFNLDEYSKYSSLKKNVEAEGQIKALELQSEQVKRLIEGAGALFRRSQNVIFLKRLDAILLDLNSSLKNYENRSLRSRDEEVALTSLRLMRKSMVLKRSALEDEIEADRTFLSRWNKEECELPNETIQSLLKESSSRAKDKGAGSLKEDELTFKANLKISQAEFEKKNRFSNLKVGPTFKREKSEEGAETRLGLAVTMDFPQFGSVESSFLSASTHLAKVEKDISLKEFAAEKRILEERVARNLKLLHAFGEDKEGSEILKLKKNFDQGLISPLVYLESYRNYVDSLESLIHARNQVFESDLKLRGLYEKNSLF